MSFKLDYDSSALKKNIDKMSDKLGAVVLMYSATKASELQAKMKINRPWTDRTAQARQRLKGTYKTIPNGYRLMLSHGVTYGKYLEATNNPNWKNPNAPGENQLTGLQTEFAYERKFAIISPTIRTKSPEIIKGLTNLLDRL